MFWKANVIVEILYMYIQKTMALINYFFFLLFKVFVKLELERKVFYSHSISLSISTWFISILYHTVAIT